MAKLTRIIAPPKSKAIRIDVDTRSHPDAEEIFEWIHEMCSRRVYWNMTDYRDPNHSNRRRVFSTRQHHFRDTYRVYSFWFPSESDASLFKLRWAS